MLVTARTDFGWALGLTDDLGQKVLLAVNAIAQGRLYRNGGHIKSLDFSPHLGWTGPSQPKAKNRRGTVFYSKKYHFYTVA